MWCWHTHTWFFRERDAYRPATRAKGLVLHGIDNSAPMDARSRFRPSVKRARTVPSAAMSLCEDWTRQTLPSRQAVQNRAVLKRDAETSSNAPHSFAKAF